MRFAHSFLLLAAYWILTSASGLPEKRAGTVVCDSSLKISGSLLTLTSGDTEEVLKAGFMDVTTRDSKNKQSKVLITKCDEGKPLDAQTFDFTPCISKYLGFSNSAPEDVPIKRLASSPAPSFVYGHLSLGGAKKHCLMTKTGSVKTADQVLTHSVCSQVDDKSQLQNTWAMNTNTGEITFAGSRANGTHHPVSLSISNVGHGAVKLNANEDGKTSLFLRPKIQVIKN